MNNPTLVHGNFTTERIYDAAPTRVFEAWSNPELKARWFIGPEGWTAVKRELDFRIGGQERLHGRFPDGSETVFTARYHDIISNRRLIYVYDMHVNQTYLSVSLASVEIEAHGAGTRVIFTEQAVYLNGKDGTASRKQGTGAHLDRLGEQLQKRR
ncbi:MAG: SRPBCC family protein [Rhodomicrobiaceae bacterium]